MITIFEQATVFNGQDEQFLENATVVVEDNRIREVSAGSSTNTFTDAHTSTARAAC